MRIKDGFILKKVDGVNAVVAVGEASESFNAVVTLNDTGAIIFQGLVNNVPTDDIADSLVGEYDIEFSKAKIDVENFAFKLLQAGIAEDK